MIKFVIEINTEKQASHDIAGNKEHADVVGDGIYGKKDTVVGTDGLGSENGEENSKDAESLHSLESYGAEDTVVIRLDTIKHECFLLVGWLSL